MVFRLPWKFAGGDPSDDEDDMSHEEAQEVAAEEAAAKERKKAGLPEINLDDLNSRIAPKMLILSYELVMILKRIINFFDGNWKTIPIKAGCRIAFKNRSKDLLSETLSELDSGLQKFDEAELLTALQQKIFS